MKHKDKILSVFGDVNTELDATDEGDKESLDIEAIENGIMNKLESMINDKLKPIDPTPEDESKDEPEESNELNNEEDSNNED